jgi:putative phosphoesterase
MTGQRMRVALVSDIHGNLTALEAVVASLSQTAPDLVIQGGDLVLMGARPAETIDRVRELGWPGVVGNTDELLWRPEEHAVQVRRTPRLRALLDLLFHAYAPHTRQHLGAERIAWLRDLPAEHRTDDLVVLHAQPGDLWRAPQPDVDADELAVTYGVLGAPHVGYGHIHRPFVREVSEFLVANAGSVGLSWDGDPRASYVLFDERAARVVRVEYDVAREVDALRASGHPDAERIGHMLMRGRFVAPREAPDRRIDRFPES